MLAEASLQPGPSMRETRIRGLWRGEVRGAGPAGGAAWRGEADRWAAWPGRSGKEPVHQAPEERHPLRSITATCAFENEPGAGLAVCFCYCGREGEDVPWSLLPWGPLRWSSLPWSPLGGRGPDSWSQAVGPGPGQFAARQAAVPQHCATAQAVHRKRGTRKRKPNTRSARGAREAFLEGGCGGAS